MQKSKHHKYLAIIPARGGSKGIPRKNIKTIAGKPLIAWSIEQALSSKNIDRIIVSTEDDEIAEIAVKYGADVPFSRPLELASDTASTEPTLAHAIKWLKDNEDYSAENIILLQATSPARKPETIDNAIIKFQSESYDSLLSVNEFWHFLWKNDLTPTALYDYQSRPRRQDILPSNITLRENGSIYITKTEFLLKFNNRLCGRIATHILDESEGFEIDSPLDWDIVETILNKMNGATLC